MKYKKIWLELGTLATIVTPVSVIIACGKKDNNKTQEIFVDQKALNDEQFRINNLTSNSDDVIILDTTPVITEAADFTKEIATTFGISNANLKKDFTYKYINSTIGITITVASKKGLKVANLTPIEIMVTYKFSAASKDIDDVIKTLSKTADYFAIANITSATNVTFTSGDLGITITNVKGTRITYSHGFLTSDGNLKVTIKVSKETGVEQTKDVVVIVYGINDSKLDKAFQSAQTFKTLIIPNGIRSNQFNDYVNKQSSFEDDYKNVITSITFPNSFTKISDWFKNFPLTSLILGTELKTIERDAFYNAKLETLTIPNAVTTIGNLAFLNSPLTLLTLGTNLQTIGEQAFEKAKLETLIIPNTVTQIGAYAFQNSPLTSLTLGIELQTIGNYAFSDAKLKTLIIPNTVTQIGRLVFTNSPLTSLTLGTELQTIGDEAFWSAQLESFVDTDISIKDASQTKVASSAQEEDIILPTSLNPKITFRIKSIKESTETPDGTTVTIELEVLFNDNVLKLYNVELSGFNSSS